MPLSYRKNPPVYYEAVCLLQSKLKQQGISPVPRTTDFKEILADCYLLLLSSVDIKTSASLINMFDKRKQVSLLNFLFLESAYPQYTQVFLELIGAKNRPEKIAEFEKSLSKKVLKYRQRQKQNFAYDKSGKFFHMKEV